MNDTEHAVSLTPAQLGFLADIVGGTGDHVWGGIARRHDLSGQDVEDLFNKLAIELNAIHYQPTGKSAIDTLVDELGAVMSEFHGGSPS